MVIKRDIHLKKLIDSKHNGMIKVVTGIRRCGKSYLLFNLFCQHMNGQPDKEEAAGTVFNASLPFLKVDECERMKGQLS